MQYTILMIFNKWKKRANRFEQYLREIEDMAVSAEMNGYAAKNSPADDKFKQIANRASLGLRDPIIYPDA